MLNHNDARSIENYITEYEQIEWIPVKCTTDKEIEQAIKNDCILICQAEGITYFKKCA
jgi:hypothetical protein